MGKDKPGFMTPKAIANRIKAKGLQKLRWYCQMCQKQCRDENGFKCHTMSESHQRQLLLFADNSGRYLDDFSKEFKTSYVSVLRRRFGTKRVNANVVYQEYISDRHHIHMNATKWLTLSSFVQYLGREGICIVDQTEKGWFVQYIDRDPETIRRQEEIEKKRKLDIDDRERQLIFLEKQIQRAKELKEEEKAQFTELKKTDEIVKLTFKKPNKIVEQNESSIPEAQSVEISECVQEQKINKNKSVENNGASNHSIHEPPEFYSEKKSKKDEHFTSSTSSIDTEAKKFETEELVKNNLAQNTLSFKLDSNVPAKIKTNNESKGEKIQIKKAEKRKFSTLDEIMKAREAQREKQNRKDYWLYKNIVVKIITDKLGEKYFNKKGVVVATKDVYVAIVKLIDTDTILKVDQAHLETVLPAIGKKVMIVNGAYRGLEAVLEDIDKESLTAKLSIASGPLKGRVINGVQYEDICKLQKEEGQS